MDSTRDTRAGGVVLLMVGWAICTNAATPMLGVLDAGLFAAVMAFAAACLIQVMQQPRALAAMSTRSRVGLAVSLVLIAATEPLGGLLYAAYGMPTLLVWTGLLVAMSKVIIDTARTVRLPRRRGRAER